MDRGRFGITKPTGWAGAFWQNKANSCPLALCVGLPPPRIRLCDALRRTSAEEGDRPPCFWLSSRPPPCLSALPSLPPFHAAHQVVEIDLELLGAADVVFELLDVVPGKLGRRLARGFGDELDHG